MDRPTQIAPESSRHRFVRVRRIGGAVARGTRPGGGRLGDGGGFGPLVGPDASLADVMRSAKARSSKWIRDEK